MAAADADVRVRPFARVLHAGMASRFLPDSTQREEAGMDEITVTAGISPARVERGRGYAALRSISEASNQEAVSSFEATSLAGKA